MKKRIVFALTVFFALTAAAGCGSASKENGGASESGGYQSYEEVWKKPVENFCCFTVGIVLGLTEYKGMMVL